MKAHRVHYAVLPSSNMKKKTVTSALIFAVAALWGTILWKVASAVNEDSGPNDVQHGVPTFNKSALQDSLLLPDTVSLKLNYPDPFLTTAGSRQDSVQVIPAERLLHDTRVLIKAVAPVQAINWSIISYTGYMGNAGSSNHQLTALISINNQTYTLREGESAAGVKLLRSMRDSVKIAYAGQTHCYQLNNR